MSERYRLQEHIQQHIKTNAGGLISEYSISIANIVMKALDSWIEEQGESEEIKIGDRVKMVAPNPDEEEDDGPLLPAYGVVSGYHRGLADPHYLVNFEKEFDQQHNGMGLAENDHGNLVEVNHGWFCHQDVLEKV